MKIQDVCNELQLTKKAIYYYEKQGLLHVKKDINGYRIFTQDDVKRLNEIILYRKWNISIQDIKKILDLSLDEKKLFLKTIYDAKRKELSFQQESLNQLLIFIENEDCVDMNKQVDYQNILQTIEDNVPGILGWLFCSHFAPFLHISITTQKQQDAYTRILRFFDDVDFKLPLTYRLLYVLQNKDKKKIEETWQNIDEYKKNLLQDEEVYDEMKRLCEKNYELSKKWWYKILNYPQRQMKIRLRDVGYYDVLIPAMKDLSLEYKEYYDRWINLNDKVCQDLGLYYDSKFRLRKKL